MSVPCRQDDHRQDPDHTSRITRPVAPNMTLTVTWLHLFLRIRENHHAHLVERRLVILCNQPLRDVWRRAIMGAEHPRN